jgi:signal transduction histidine kinase
MTPSSRRRLTGWLATIALVAAVTVVIKLLHPDGPARGLAVIYILVVVSVAVRWGPAFAFAASLLSAAAFDYFFLNPQDMFGLDLSDAEAFAAFLATAIMASQLAGRLRRQVREAARLAKEQAALRRVASLVAQGAPPIEVFSAIAEEASLLFDAEIALLLRHEPDGMSAVLAGWGSVGARVPVGSRWPSADPLAVAPPTETDGAAAGVRSEAAPGASAEIVHRLAVRSSVVRPILIEGRPWGLILVATRSTTLSADARQQVGDFSELLATAIRNADNQAELRASRARIVAAADETRRRIERDLHDSAQQRLVSLALSVRAVQAAVPPDGTELRAELAQVADGLVSVLDELRELARGLHPAILAEGGLQRALKALARRSPIAVELTVGIQERLPQQIEVTAYYVVSELLTNAAKYAQASEIQVGVHAPDSVLLLSVRDDGIGGADPARGSGLVGVRDRVEAIGGTVAVHSPIQAGTRVDIEIPIVGISGDAG